MRLSELMGHMDLAIWPQLALVLFLWAFGAVLWRVFRRGARAEADRNGLLPLSDDVMPATGNDGRTG